MEPTTLPAEPLVSLLLPNLNNERMLDHVLERLATNTTYPHYELIVVDDGSTDASREIFRRWRDSGRFPRFELIEKENSGVVDTLNHALEVASGDVCVQLDADASIETPGWLERMLDLLMLDDRVGVVSAKVVTDYGQLDACGIDVVDEQGFRGRPTTLDEPAGQRLFHYRVVRIQEGEGGAQESELAEVDAAAGCCLMYRRDDALAVGGYDPGYAPVWFDDVDLCLSIRRRGRKVFYLPDVRVLHHLAGRKVDGRWDRYQPTRLVRAARRRIYNRTPRSWTVAIERRTRHGMDLAYTPAQYERMRRQYAHWRRKWGWDMVNPDMAEVRRLHGETEICWATDPDKRAVGEAIVAAYRKRHPLPAAA